MLREECSEYAHTAVNQTTAEAEYLKYQNNIHGASLVLMNRLWR